jgi:hypothetical protein
LAFFGFYKLGASNCRGNFYSELSSSWRVAEFFSLLNIRFLHSLVEPLLKAYLVSFFFFTGDSNLSLAPLYW